MPEKQTTNKTPNLTSPTITDDSIKDKIYTIRSVQVMLDSDLAEMYGVETRVLNQAFKRNIERFPERFCFQLNQNDMISSKSQIVILDKKAGRGNNIKYMPYAFTEAGVSMLSSVLRSKIAINVSIKIIDAFVAMRHFITDNAGIFQRIEHIETKLITHDEKFDTIFKYLKPATPNNAVIFFDGTFYDSKSFIAELIKQATSSIILIDDYISKATLDILRQRQSSVTITIYTLPHPKNSDYLSAQEISAFTKQYGNLEIKHISTFHDRFLILDKSELYSVGASLKDAGNKTFAINKITDPLILESLLQHLL